MFDLLTCALALAMYALALIGLVLGWVNLLAKEAIAEGEEIREHTQW